MAREFNSPEEAQLAAVWKRNLKMRNAMGGKSVGRAFSLFQILEQTRSLVRREKRQY